jgi:hypothetical protein
MRRLLLGVLVIAVLVVPTPATSASQSPSAWRHLEALVKRSPAPEYRRAGTPGMERVATYEATVLRKAGYAITRQDVALGPVRWNIDYAKGHAPLLARLDDGHRFKTESLFNLTQTTGVDGITCEVRAIADVRPGDCGFIPFAQASPEWKNVNADLAGAADEIIAKGGVGAVVQGDVARNAVIALNLRKPLPAVVAVADEAEVVGRRVRLRVMGAKTDAVAHNVIGVRRPPTGAADYVMLLAHADGWFQAAADNGGGAAAVLRAAELLAGLDPGVGVVVALVDAEEIGLLGSRALAEALSSPEGLAVPGLASGLHMADLSAVINLDASTARASDVQDPVAGVTGADAPVFSWRTMVYSEHATLPGLFLETFSEHGVLGLPVNSKAAVQINGSWRTDAGWFHEAGVPVAWPAVGYPEYHTDADSLRAVDRADLEHVAEAAAALVPRLAGLPRTPIIE